MTTVERRELLKAKLGGWNVSTADVREIRLAPGQQSGRHLHPCAVLGYIAEGSAVYQIEGEPEQVLPAGSAFFEPPQKVIANFGNASSTDPVTFIAFYLLDGEQDLITMVQEGKVD